jgi:hypothetical protein
MAIFMDDGDDFQYGEINIRIFGQLTAATGNKEKQPLGRQRIEGSFQWQVLNLPVLNLPGQGEWVTGFKGLIWFDLV